MNTVMSVCKQVRRKAEYFALTSGKYHSDLEGMCAIVSRALQIALRKRGIECDLVTGYYDLGDCDDPFSDLPNHCWVQIGDVILDLTYSQFDGDRKIHQEKYDHRFSSYNAIHINPDDKHFRKWPVEQRPYLALVRNLVA